MTTTTEVKPGRVLGRYQLLLPVAAGGMGMVWAARLRGTRGFQKVVAIKTLLPSMATDPQFEQMFLDEAGLASRINHPNVVEVIDLGEQAGVLYQVMEWVDGETLRSIMKAAAKAGTRVPEGIAVRLMMQVCGGLHAAHQLKDDGNELLGVIHRDVSPQNILLTKEGVAKVADFGIAKLAKQGAQSDGGAVKGKVGYMAPEQITGENFDHRIDIFALGVILYELTTGKHPFRGENDVATATNICTRDLVPPDKVVSGYPLLLSKVISKALAKKKEDRYASANEMLRALDQTLPPAKRVSTDVEVASYLKTLFGDHKGPPIAQAVRAADEEESVRGTTEVVFDESAMLTEMQGFTTTSTGITQSSDSNLGAPLSDPALATLSPPAPKRPFVKVALAAFAVLAVIGILLGVVAATRTRTPVDTASTNTSASTQPILEPSASTPIVVASAPVTSVATPSASAPVGHATRPKPVATASAKPTGKPSANAYASPITNPGF